MFRILKKENASLVILQLYFWSLMCVTYTFLSSYLYQKGISISIVAFTFSISKFIGIFTQVSLIAFLKQDQNERKIIKIGIILMTMTLFIIYISNNVFIKLVGIIVLGIFENSLPTLMDSWLINITKKVTTFTFIKSFASLSFSASSLIIGILIGEVGFKLIPIISLILLTFNIYQLTRVVNKSVVNSVNVHNEKNYRNLPNLYSWMIIAFGIGFIILPFNQILPLLILRVEGNQGWIGIIVCVTTLSQFVVMLLNHKFVFKNTDIQITISYTLYILGLIILINKGVIFILISQAFFGVGLGVFIPAFKSVVISMSSNENIRRNLFIGDLIIFSIAPFIISFIFGFALSRFDLVDIINVYIFILIITIVSYLLINTILRRREE